MPEIPYTKNLMVISLSIAIFISIIMGFVIGSVVANSRLKDTLMDVGALLNSEVQKINETNASEFDKLNNIHKELVKNEPLIIGLNVIEENGLIVYSDEAFLMGNYFSDRNLIRKAIKKGSLYFVDRNLISKETSTKKEYSRLLLIYYSFNLGGKTYLAQILYDISHIENSIDSINLLIWATVLSSIGILILTLLILNTYTSKTLEELKNSMESEVRKRTHELEKSKQQLDEQVKDRTKELEKVNKEFAETNKSIQKQNVDLIKRTIELTELKGQLEDKNVDLESANKEILELLQIKSDFINRAAHDLRTPLTPLLTLLPIIRDKADDQEIKRNADIAEKNARYLHLLVDDLINMIKMERGVVELNIRKINLVSLIDEVLSNNQTVTEANKVEVIKKIGPGIPTIKGDKLRLMEVFQNIIINAIKFMHKKPKILTITVSKMDKFINVEIRDTGIGMSRETLLKLFEPFFKADKSRHYVGSGLGLSICKKIIENHNGKIWAESKGRGKGSVIIFTLPL